MFSSSEVETLARDTEQLDLVAFVQIVKDFARAEFAFYEHFKLRVFGRTGKREISGFFAGDAENRDLTGNEIYPALVANRIKVKRPRQTRLIANPRYL